MTKQNRTLNDEIQTQINHTLQTQPYPTQAQITKIYQNGYTDITTEQYGDLTYIPTIGNPEINDLAILIFLDNTYENKIVITQTTIPED